MLFFKQILNGTAENLGDTVKRLGTCFIDVLVPLLIHLDGAEADTGAFIMSWTYKPSFISSCISRWV